MASQLKAVRGDDFELPLPEQESRSQALSKCKCVELVSLIGRGAGKVPRGSETIPPREEKSAHLRAIALAGGMGRARTRKCSLQRGGPRGYLPRRQRFNMMRGFLLLVLGLSSLQAARQPKKPRDPPQPPAQSSSLQFAAQASNNVTYSITWLRLSR